MFNFLTSVYEYFSFDMHKMWPTHFEQHYFNLCHQYLCALGRLINR